MQADPSPDYRKARQQLADMNEDLELKRWTVSYPTWMELQRAIEYAARRAACLARLEDALTHLH